MTNCMSPSVESVAYESHARARSETMPGVTFTIARVSFSRRLDLARRVREMAQRVEFLDAGDELKEKVESSILKAEIDRMYIDWALVSVEGLSIDGELANPALLLERGPEPLTREIVDRIRAECHLSEDERKN
jgi:hypothetical protein